MAARDGILRHLIVFAVLLRCGAAADTYYVGDDTAWSVPPGGAAAYSLWAGEKSFELGDTVGKQSPDIHGSSSFAEESS